MHHFQDNGLLKLSFCHWEEDIIEHTAHTICHLESITNIIEIVKLREREGQGVDPGRSLKGHL